VANVLRVNKRVKEIRVADQLRWDNTMRTIVLQSGLVERALVSLIHAAVTRRIELKCHVPGETSPFHGYLSCSQGTLYHFFLFLGIVWLTTDWD
jgi:hypothetical protein